MQPTDAESSLQSRVCDDHGQALDATFIPEERITHPRDAKAACHAYIIERCSFRYEVTENGAEARTLENRLKADLSPALNP